MPSAFRIDFYLHNPMRRIVLYWLPPVLWMGLIFWFSTDRFSSVETGSRFDQLIGWVAPWLEEVSRARLHLLIRKLGHFTEYGLLALLWMRAFESGRWSGRSGEMMGRWRARALLVILIVAAYALLDEWHQTLTVSRTGSLVDCAIDTFGGTAGLLLRRLLTEDEAGADSSIRDGD